MLFAVDVGNTNITVGLFDGKKLIKTFRITTGTARTSDEYGVYFVDWLRVRDIHVSEIDAVIIASVVPKVMHSLTSGIIKYLNIQPIIVAPGIKTGINIAIPEPKTLGADRLVDAVAAYELYGGPVIVVDFGTATTHDLVLEGGVFHSGRHRRESDWRQQHSGPGLQSFQKSKSRDQIRFWQRIQSAVCRQVYSMAMLVRPSILSAGSRKSLDWITSRLWQLADLVS